MPIRVNAIDLIDNCFPLLTFAGITDLIDILTVSCEDFERQGTVLNSAEIVLGAVSSYCFGNDLGRCCSNVYCPQVMSPFFILVEDEDAGVAKW